MNQWISTAGAEALLAASGSEAAIEPRFIVDLVLTAVIIVALGVFIGIKINRMAVWIYYGVSVAVYILALCFNLNNLAIVAILAILLGTVVFCFINAGIIRKYVAMPLKGEKLKGTTKKEIDQNKLIQNVVTAVEWLSSNKVGALITFERSTPLEDFMKSGTIINAPFTPELVETIFYEGTRLHDGAIIVRGDTIIAAAVYYPPSTKAVVGKFGARHRAALGISEITDSVTIVVSEETGRVAIAHAGIMDNVKTDEFERVFRNLILG